VPGEEAEGVLQALEYLKDVQLGRPVELGARVVVIGGGNSAVDAARVALRNKNVRKVTILYRRTRKEMPAYPEEIEAALEEGVKVEFLTAPTWVLTKDGRVTSVRCQRMKLGEKDESGRPKPVPVEGSEFVVSADTLILALSERAYTPYLKESDGLTLSPKWGRSSSTRRPWPRPGLGCRRRRRGHGAEQRHRRHRRREIGRRGHLQLPRGPAPRPGAPDDPASFYVPPVELKETRSSRRNGPRCPPSAEPAQDPARGSRARVQPGSGRPGGPALPPLRA